jgi:hypothetical protein
MGTHGVTSVAVAGGGLVGVGGACAIALSASAHSNAAAQVPR